MPSRIDSARTALYKSPLSWAAALLLLAPATARSESIHGAQLPDGAQKVGENRYRAKEDFDGVVKYYRSVYPPAAYPRKSIVNRPEVKAVHITNPSMKNFEGLNIYVANDEVRIYVIPVVEAKPTKKKGTEKPAAKR
jgi:hypothetical protein